MKDRNINKNKCLRQKQRTVSLPQIQSLVALLFKDEGVLDAHPLSCHPRRVFGYLENAKKMREKGKKVRKAGELKASPVNFID